MEVQQTNESSESLSVFVLRRREVCAILIHAWKLLKVFVFDDLLAFAGIATVIGNAFASWRHTKVITDLCSSPEEDEMSNERDPHNKRNHM